MQFATAVPWWTLLLLAVAIAALAWSTYTGRAVVLPPSRRVGLAGLRAAALLVLVACLLRPVRVLPPDSPSDAVVPVLVDMSRSMSLDDGSGRPRVESAWRVAEADVLPMLRQRFVSEVWGFGDGLRQFHTSAQGAIRSPDDRTADARRSDLTGALQELRERYRDRRLAGIVVISDGGDTGTADVAASLDGSVPVHTIGVGAVRIPFDREVLDVAAGEAPLADSAIDVMVTAVSHGSDAPFDIRLLEDERPVDLRRVAPAGPGSPVRAVFTVAPAAGRATLYTAEIAETPGELAIENNSRSVSVEPPQRARRVLMIEGSPGFEHAFLKRALNADAGLETDALVRKGRNAAGESTFFIQAPAARAERLLSGFPADRAALYSYDAILLANVEPGTLAPRQLEELHAFVDERGGGLLVLGARSFAPGGLASTPLEAALPLRLGDRTPGVVNASAGGSDPLAVTVTAEGAAHPAMRIARSADDVLKRWTAVPPLAGVSTLGTPRPGAHVLASVSTPGGQRPLVAVQRYGRGRTMVFAGEGSWRWRMMMPSTDRTYELFWRHAVRWLASSAPERLLVAPVPSVLPGDSASIAIEVRDPEFKPVSAARVDVRVTAPSGSSAELTAIPTDASAGRYTVAVRFDEPGLYRITAESRAGSDVLTTERWVLAGGADREMSQPQLNEEVLRRISGATGGRSVAADDVRTLAAAIDSAAPAAEAPRVQDVWHTPWVFGAVVMLLTAEWILRRRWGLR